MNNKSEENRFSSIIPASRKSIHSYRNCTRSCCNKMVRYGITTKKSSSFESRTAHKTDYDEVDNVMSKYQRSPSQTDRIRRSSWSNDKRDNDLLGENECFNVAERNLAKSVPAKLPSYLYYSDSADDDTEVEDQEENTTANSSSSILQDSFDTGIRTQTTRTSSERTDYTFERNRIREESRRKQKLSVKNSMFALVTVLLVSIGAMKINQDSSEDIYDDDKFFKELALIGQTYRIDSNAILQIQSGVSTIYKREDTGSFIFVYNSEGRNANKNLNKFMNEIAEISARYLRNDTARVFHFVVGHDDLDMNEHGELVNKFRGLLNDRGVMLFENLERIPSHLAMAFHYYCDEFNPLVRRSVVLFTLDLHNCSIPLDKVTHALLEKCLRTKWNSLSNDTLGPLLTRVISVVIDLTKNF